MTNAEIDLTDWFRIPCDRKEWRQKVAAAYPSMKLCRREREALDSWRPGRALPGTEVEGAGEEAQGNDEASSESGE